MDIKDFGSASVLILTNDAALAADCSKSLRDLGIRSFTVHGQEACGTDGAMNELPDLVLADSLVLGGPSRDLLKQLKALPPHLACPVVYLEQEGEAQAGDFLEDVDEVIRYPLDPQRFLLRCRTLLNAFWGRKAWHDERQKLEEELKQRAKRADKALLLLKQAEQRMMDGRPGKPANHADTEDVVADMSHELRTPLNAILGFSEIMKDEVLGPLGNTRYQEYASDIHKASQHLLGIVNDVLELSKSEADVAGLDIEDVSVRDTVVETVRLLTGLAEAAGIEVAVNVPDGFPVLRTDERRFRQVLVNILSNAIKFTRRGGRVCIEGRKDAKDGAILMIIRDNGIGMSPSELVTALTPYGQVEGAQINTHVRGTGLGLPISRRAVESLGGEFTITSEPGIGTAVTLRFPPELINQ